MNIIDKTVCRIIRRYLLRTRVGDTSALQTVLTAVTRTEYDTDPGRHTTESFIKGCVEGLLIGSHRYEMMYREHPVEYTAMIRKAFDSALAELNA